MKRMRMALLTASIGIGGCQTPDRLAEPSFPTGPAAAVSAAGLAAPSDLRAVASSQTRVDLSWRDNSSNESRFEIRRSTTGPSGTFASIAATGADVQAYRDQGLAPATEYCYQVRAVLVRGRSDAYSASSNTACATTLPQPPNAAQILSAVPLDSSTVRVYWHDNSPNEDGFRVYRSPVSESSWVLAGLTTGDVFVDSGVPNAEMWMCYRVVAFGAGGDAPPSDVACTTPPAAPTNFSVTTIDDQTLNLSWNDNSAVEDAYQVWGRIFWGPNCSGSGCDAVLYTLEWVIAELPANSTSYRCSTCAGALLWVVARKGDSAR